MSNQLKLLDCTLRDGGYYNSWDFDRDLVIKYLSSMTSSKVDYVEIGFRYLPDSKKYLGPYAYTTEDFLKSLNISSSLKLGVMINADEYLSTKDPSMTINKNFLKAEDSSISLVRIAINFDKYKNSKVLIDSLKDLGYLGQSIDLLLMGDDIKLNKFLATVYKRKYTTIHPMVFKTIKYIFTYVIINEYLYHMASIFLLKKRLV